MEYSELIIVKAGTGVVATPDQQALDRDAMRHIGQNINQLMTAEAPTGVVLVSSGAYPAGIEQINHADEVLTDTRRKQVATMVGNKVLFAEWEYATNLDVAFDLPTHNDLRHNESWNNLVGVTATALEMGILPAFNEGDARSTEELQRSIQQGGNEFMRFGDNDQLALMIGLKIGRFALDFGGIKTKFIFLTDVDGVYEDRKNPDSLIPELTVGDIDTILSGSIDDSASSNGGMTSKLAAAREATLAGHDVRIGNGKQPDALLQLHQGIGGTHIAAA